MAETWRVELSHTSYRLYQAESHGAAIVLRTAGPLMLAIAGSALVPLPCAFGQMGIPVGTVLLLLIAAANDYTTVVMVRAAATAMARVSLSSSSNLSMS